MSTARDILNELKWREDRNISDAEIWYVHRGAPNDTKIISGGDILALERSFMILSDASIPYHRIFRIVYQSKTIFEKRKKE